MVLSTRPAWALFATTGKAWAALLLSLQAVHAQEKKEDKPRVIAVAPMTLTPGATVLLKIRGAKLTNATALRFPSAPELAATIKQKKAADAITGLDAKDVGDTLVEAEVTVPADFAIGPLTFTVVTPDGDASDASVLVRSVSTTSEEKEPNDGFTAAQSMEFNRLISGSIKQDKDVDVFRFSGRAKQRLTAEVSASCCGSLLDAGLTLFDAGGQILAANDDIAATRDARLEAELPTDGVYFLCINDAHDRGGAWHNYELSVKGVVP